MTPEAVGKGSSQVDTPVIDLDKLLVEVYTHTGRRLTADDPVVVAALVQSTLIRRAGVDAASSLQEAVCNAVADLAAAVQVERDTARQLDRTVADAFQQITSGAKAAGDQEVAAMQARFARAATDTLDKVRKEASKAAPSWWKTAVVALSGILLGGIVGLALGKSGSPRINNEQIRLMHNGMLLDAAWEKLPKASRELIEAGAVGKPEGDAKGDTKGAKIK